MVYMSNYCNYWLPYCFFFCHIAFLLLYSSYKYTRNIAFLKVEKKAFNLSYSLDSMEILVKRGRTNKKKILVLIHPWSTVKNLFYLVKKNLPNEYGYLEYYYSKDILNSSPITSSN